MNRFGILLVVMVAGMMWGTALCGHSAAADGKAIYVAKCQLCHGPKGDGKGPSAGAYNPPPTAFNNPKFWQDDVTKKATESITNGKGGMDPIKELKPDEIKAVIDYLSQTFKK